MTEPSNSQPTTKLHIAFPKSDEDHRLQLVEINGSIFAFLFAPLESLGPIRLLCEEWSLVLLAPIKSKTNIVISGINVICLNEIVSEEGNVNLHASNRLVRFADLVQPTEKLSEMGEKGEFHFDDDPGAFLHYYRLFESVVTSIHQKNPDAFAEAQQKFLVGLCTLADKIEGKPESLDLKQVLKIWGISTPNT